MKIKEFIFAYIFFNVICLHTSYSQRYNAVDNIVLKYPNFDSTKELAKRIEKDFKSDYDKARAIYSWIAFNIEYDFNAYLNPSKTQGFSYRTEDEKQRKIQEFNTQILQKAFKSEKAVCEGFTLLFQHLSSLVGIKSEVVKGDSKTRLIDIGRKNTSSNHAWNIALIDKKWRLIDVTWGQGYYENNKGKMVKDFDPLYFDTEPDYFFAKHFPDSGTFLGKKLNKNEFLNGPLIYNKAISGDYKIITPESGILEANKGDKITFVIKNISKSDPFYYVNKKNQPVRIVNSKEKRGGLEFQVVFDNTIGDYLTFYLDTYSIVSFKVISK